MTPRWIAVLVVPLAIAAAPPDRSVERLIGQLGSEVFAEREDASRKLEAIGEPALAALERAARSDDLEVSRRAGRIVAALEERLYPELRLVGHTGPLHNVCVSSDGKQVLTSSTDRTLRLWDAYTGKQLRVFVGHTDLIYGAALSADGSRVLSGSVDKTVRLWDAATGKELRRYKGHGTPVTTVAYFPDGRRIAATSWDGTTRIWRTPR
jgi:WD40 repeat protein